jgi:hypothetical protein
LGKVIDRLNQQCIHFYSINYEGKTAGAVRIVPKDNGNRCRINPLFILPEYQDKGIAQEVFKIIETEYRPQKGWESDTILKEQGNCHLYEKMGYKRTGEYKKINNRMTLVYYGEVGPTSARTHTTRFCHLLRYHCVLSGTKDARPFGYSIAGQTYVNKTAYKADRGKNIT